MSINFQITKNQHILPLASIKRFYLSKNDAVDIFFISTQKRIFVKANNKTFVAKQKWDEYIERESRKIESSFQNLVGMSQRLRITVGQKENPNWGIFKSAELEFVVSDQYHFASLIPINPTTYLVKDHPNKIFNTFRCYQV